MMTFTKHLHGHEFYEHGFILFRAARHATLGLRHFTLNPISGQVKSLGPGSALPHSLLVNSFLCHGRNGHDRWSFKEASDLQSCADCGHI